MKIRRVQAGDRLEAGKYVCNNCGAEINVVDDGEMPICPRCEGKFFKESRR